MNELHEKIFQLERQAMNSGNTGTVAAVLIVSNASEYLERCLESVAPHVDEIVLYENNSTWEESQKMGRIASKYNHRYFIGDWKGSFAQARNEAKKDIVCSWILSIDADEVFKFNGNFRETLQKADPDLGGLMINVISEVVVNGTHGISNTPQVRLFRNKPGIDWENYCHEDILPAVIRAGYVAGSFEGDIAIEHSGYSDPEVSKKKTARNLRLLNKDIEDNQNFVAYMERGRLYLNEGDFNKAEEDLNKAVQLKKEGHPQVFQLLKLHCLTAYNAGWYETAKIRAQTWMFATEMEDPDGKKYYPTIFPKLIIADCFHAAAKFEMAVEAYEQIINQMNQPGIFMNDSPFSPFEIQARIIDSLKRQLHPPKTNNKPLIIH